MNISSKIGMSAATPSAEWVTVYTMNATRAHSGGWANYNMRNVYAIGEFSQTGGTQMRITFLGSQVGGEDFGVVEAYAGEAAGAGDAYDFAETPTQIKFSGSDGVLIPQGSEVVSDVLDIGKAASGAFIVSIKMEGAANDSVTRSNTGMDAGSSMHYRANANAATVDASAYTAGTGAYGFVGVGKIELLI